MLPTPVRSLLALTCALACSAALAQDSARDLYEAEQTRHGTPVPPGHYADWHYDSSPLSAEAKLDFSTASGYISAEHAKTGDLALVAVRNQSSHAYCLRPKLKFTGKVRELRRMTGNVLVPAQSSVMLAQMRVERRTPVVQHLDAAFWPAPTGRDPHRCDGNPPAGLQAWVDAPGLKPFPRNRVVTAPNLRR